MAIFEGAGVALVTPFKENGTVNYEVLESLIEEQIAAGTDCIVAMGTTGESATTSEEEHIQVIRFVCEVVNGRIPVVAGTGSNCTQTAVELSVEAEEAGADGVLLVSPYYNKATQNGLKAHFAKIANSIKIPAILYNVPSRTGVNIAPETIVDLCRHVENIVGVKEASGNFSAAAKILQLSGGYVDVYSGNDDQVVPMLALGGKGVISVLSNVAPKQTHDMCAEFFKGNIEASRRIQLKAMPLIEALFSEVNPIPVKAALNLMGKNVGEPRLPLTVMEPQHQALKAAPGSIKESNAGFRYPVIKYEEKNMIRAIMNGCHGVMGHVITDIISKDDAIEIVAGVDMNTENYVGNIEPGKSGNVDTMINGIAPTADDGKVKLSITYEDENGKVSTVEKEIQLMVNEDQSMDESNVDDTWNSDDVQPEPSTTDKLKHLAIPVGIVGVVLAAVILVVIRRKKKKAGMDDEIL